MKASWTEYMCLVGAAPHLLHEITRTHDLATALMERAARLDRRLHDMRGAVLDSELGEITRMRAQLARNQAAIAKAKGETP